MLPDFNIEIPRQGDWTKEFRLTDIAGVSIDLTGHTIAWNARLVAGTGAVIASAAIEILEAANGLIRASWHGPDFDNVGEPTAAIRPAHDLKDTYPDGKVDVPFRGQLIILPKVTP